MASVEVNTCQYAPATPYPGAFLWYGPGFRESDNWRRAQAQGENPPRTILPGFLFRALRGGTPSGPPGKNILSYPSCEAALAALADARERLSKAPISKPLCDLCEVREVVYRVSLTEADQTILDVTLVCRECWETALVRDVVNPENQGLYPWTPAHG